MKWLLLISLFGRCPSQTTIEYKTLAMCQAQQARIEAEWKDKNVDGYTACIQVDK